jgi:hypothetical protein
LSPELVCHAALEARGLATQINITLVPRGESLREFFLKTIQSVIDNGGM